VALSAGVEESVTWTVKREVPAAVGIPEIVPDDDSDNPAGRVPEVSAQV